MRVKKNMMNKAGFSPTKKNGSSRRTNLIGSSMDCFFSNHYE